jgi:putative membrane protein
MNKLAEYYSWFKAIHLIAVMSWMAGLLYLPRLFVYHTKTKFGSEMDLTFQIMERKLFKFIMTPAMIITYIFGIILASIYGLQNLGLWFHYKVLFVLILSASHGFMSLWIKKFANGENKNSEKFYRIINEIPTLLMIAIVILVIVKPWDD